MAVTGGACKQQSESEAFKAHRLFVSEGKLMKLGAFGAVSNEDGVGPPGRCDEDLECTAGKSPLSERRRPFFFFAN